MQQLTLLGRGCIDSTSLPRHFNQRFVEGTVVIPVRTHNVGRFIALTPIQFNYLRHHGSLPSNKADSPLGHQSCFPSTSSSKSITPHDYDGRTSLASNPPFPRTDPPKEKDNDPHAHHRNCGGSGLPLDLWLKMQYYLRARFISGKANQRVSELVVAGASCTDN